MAELIRSYTGYALVVAQYQYAAGQTEHIREVSEVLGLLCMDVTWAAHDPHVGVSLMSHG